MSFADWIIAKVGKWLNTETGEKKAFLTDFDSLSYEIRPGDVLLIEGLNRISRLIRSLTHSPWTHATLYIGRLHDIDDPVMRKKIQKHYSGPPDSQLLIESMLGKGTIVTPLAHYRNHHSRICRPQGLSRIDAQHVINYGINRLGMRYSVRHIFDLYRYLLPYAIIPRRWRSSLFTKAVQQPTEDICSSMIAHAFSSVDFPILPIVKKDIKETMRMIHRNPRIFVPSDFDYSPYFSIIKYPLFNIEHRTAYHDLPWDRQHVGNSDEEIISTHDEDDQKDENCGENHA